MTASGPIQPAAFIQKVDLRLACGMTDRIDEMDRIVRQLFDPRVPKDGRGGTKHVPATWLSQQ